MSRPKLLIYADVPGWAYDHISSFVRDGFKDEYDWYFDYTICHLFVFKNASTLIKLKHDLINFVRFLYRLLRGKKLTKITLYTFFNYRLTFFWQKKFHWRDQIYARRVLPFWYKYDAVILLDYYFNRVARLNYVAEKTIKGLYFDGFPPPGCKFDFLTRKNPGEMQSLLEFANEYLSNVDAVAGGSPSIVERFKPYFSNIHFCNAIHREEIFIEKDIRMKLQDETLIIGWTGNPGRDFKNFNTIVEPVVKNLQEKGLNIRLKTRFTGPYQTLPQFYSDVDLILVASEKDAGPFMFAEASLSGVPAISTSVGFPSFVIKNMVNGFLVNLDIKEFAERIEYVYSHRDILYSMSSRIRNDYLEKMGSTRLISNWRSLFVTIGI